MPQQPILVAHSTDRALEAGFAKIRTRLEVPESFSSDVLNEADSAIESGPMIPPGVHDVARVDKRNLPFVAIDPPGSRDLDQAFCAQRREEGYRIWYAIADLGAFVSPGGAIDSEARSRGVTLYSPDSRASLHPETINEGAASLLPGQDRPAVLWTLDLDRHGELERFDVMRATVTNRAAITYAHAQAVIDDDVDVGGGVPQEVLHLLAEIGTRREAIEVTRGAVNLRLPTQEIECHDGHYDLQFDDPLPVEGWNAQISLLTGMAAAEIMLDGGVGLLRTLPPPDDYTLNQMRRTASLLEIDWPKSVGYPQLVRELQAADPKQAAMLVAAARGLRGAGYLAFRDHETPRHTEHSAIAANYAHVTAPLRRVCDRFANEVVLAIAGGYPVPDWALDALDDLPAIMGRARQKSGALEREQLDFAESLWLRDRVGETFRGVVTSTGDRYATILIREPAVIASIGGGIERLGTEIDVVLKDVIDEPPYLVMEPAG